MSKPRKNLSSLLLAVAASMMLILSGMPVSAAHAGPEVTPAEGTATSIQINQTKNLAVGYSKPLVLKALPEGSDVPEVTWTSSDAAKATVSEDGIVTGVAPGTVTITATSKADASITSSVDLLVRSSYRYNVEWSGTFNAANNNQTTTSNLPETPEEAQEAWQVSGVGNSATVIVDGYIYTYDGTSMSGSLTNQGTLWKIDKKTGAAEKALVCDASTSY